MEKSAKQAAYALGFRSVDDTLGVRQIAKIIQPCASKAEKIHLHFVRRMQERFADSKGAHEGGLTGSRTADDHDMTILAPRTFCVPRVKMNPNRVLRPVIHVIDQSDGRAACPDRDTV